LRVSTAKQANREMDVEGLSLPAQREACYRKAEQLGAEVVDEYIDKGESAKTAQRRNFQAMLRRIQTDRDVDYVICDKLDRFARNRRDDANMLFELKAAGAQLVSVKENVDETPAGQLLHAIMAGIAEFYSRNLGTEALKGMTQKAKVGGTPGRAPIGYLNVRDKIDGREIRTVVVDPERAPLVQWAFDAYSTGEWTITSLTDELRARGLRAVPNGRAKVPGPVTRSSVGLLLTNRYYLGMVSFCGVEYQGRHQPLVQHVVFDRVQDILASRRQSGEKQRTHRHYLKGSIFCADCGSRLSFTRAKAAVVSTTTSTASAVTNAAPTAKPAS
jgi:DNA invertase Pin-like site-specific DNA recombinase